MHTCEDMFLMCLWKGKQVNCNDIFAIHKTDNGFCCSFNALNISEMFQTSEDINNKITKHNITECSIERRYHFDIISCYFVFVTLSPCFSFLSPFSAAAGKRKR